MENRIENIEVLRAEAGRWIDELGYVRAKGGVIRNGVFGCVSMYKLMPPSAK